MTDEEILACDNVPVRVAAQYLGVGDMFIRCGLRAGILPFGSAVKRGRYSYLISPGALVEYKRCRSGLWRSDEKAAE